MQYAIYHSMLEKCGSIGHLTITATRTLVPSSHRSQYYARTSIPALIPYCTPSCLRTSEGEFFNILPNQKQKTNFVNRGMREILCCSPSRKKRSSSMHHRMSTRSPRGHFHRQSSTRSTLRGNNVTTVTVMQEYSSEEV